MGAAKPDFRKPWRQRLAYWWGHPDPDARPETGPSTVDELMGRLSLPSDDDEPPAVSPPRLRPGLQPSSDEDAPAPASAPAVARKKPKRAPRSREAQLHALSKEELLDAHEGARQQLIKRREEPGQEGLQVPERVVDPELSVARLVELTLKLEKRAQYRPPERLVFEDIAVDHDDEALDLQPTLLPFLGAEAPAPGVKPEGGFLVVDLFCSVGGVSAGAAAAGHTVVLAIDMEQWRLDVHELNHPHCRHLRLKLGPETEEQVVAAIREAVPPEQWHRCWIHASPPCQAQSSLLNAESSLNKQGKKDKKSASTSTVRWALELLQKLKPPQFSVEEVDDLQQEVRSEMQRIKRADRSFLDFDLFHMHHFGLPQRRHRLIAGRPATVHALRHARSLRCAEFATPRQALAKLPLEDSIVYMQSSFRQKMNANVVRCVAPGHFKYSGAAATTLDVPCMTLACTAFRLLNAEFEIVRYANWQETCALMSFNPETFNWPDSVSPSRRINGAGNAVPPLFAEVVFRAAVTTF